MTLRVGVWPASGMKENAFVALFCEGLRSAGIDVVDVRSPDLTDPGSIDVFHIHWPEQIFWGGSRLPGVLRRLFLTLNAIRRFRRRGVRIVWMVHNLEPHDMSSVQRLIWRFYRSQLCWMTDGFMTLSPATIKVVRDNIAGLRAKPAEFVWHPSYPKVSSETSRDTTRRRLGIEPENRLYGSLGLLRPYKGIESLIAIFIESMDPKSRLIIAGGASDQLYVAKLEALIGSDSRIDLRAKHLPDEEFANLLAAIDVMVLPFHNSLHSGSIMHAISAHRRVVTKESAFARSLAKEIGVGWITTYEGALDVAFLRNEKMPERLPDLSSFTTQALGEKTRDFYLSLSPARKRLFP